MKSWPKILAQVRVASRMASGYLLLERENQLEMVQVGMVQLLSMLICTHFWDWASFGGPQTGRNTSTNTGQMEMKSMP